MLVLFNFLFSPYFIPTAIQEIGGHYGIISIYGSIVDGERRPTQYAYLLNMLHTLAVTSPLIFVLSVMIQFKKFSAWYLVDVIFYLISGVVCLYITLTSIVHATRFVFAITNFPFIIVPTITTIICIFLALKARGKITFNI
ncbi:hypothetical protein TVAG_219630 [Trichomonas vaginalis G3]|uniref:Uncharacterized protein n=1 Tax=Trichomonas vaginalis (strain ATCC PRA-98 / G3) TaxID=412133 RepID=A2DXS2_TRIV3|nr:hypothetical protein TVAGG3_0683280 [Trichomonas vaginalis G3]EAY14782.1 hypothetical protein TVAG_219630 [Trichomonas vaginalis G3]KAI5508056.1 hypothetical protein TVAGG3_0683280 [Trichomonas vaginalis G3]|eukprot:XP_001327005.1 hypothetical protein [Trichomonas vaginalis G3]